MLDFPSPPVLPLIISFSDSRKSSRYTHPSPSFRRQEEMCGISIYVKEIPRRDGNTPFYTQYIYVVTIPLMSDCCVSPLRQWIFVDHLYPYCKICQKTKLFCSPTMKGREID